MTHYTNRVIIGSQLGDEAKGKLTNFICSTDKINTVVKFSGSGNAGHTIYLKDEKFVFNLLPCGVLNPGVMNVMSTGVLINPLELVSEINTLVKRGIDISSKNLKIAGNAYVLTEIDKAQDAFNENQLGQNKIGTTKKGVGPAASNKVSRRGIKMVSLLNLEKIKSLYNINEYNLQAKMLSFYKSYNDFVEELYVAGQFLKEYICDTSFYLNNAVKTGGVLFEGTQSSLLDIDHGSFPYTTSTNCIAGYAAVSGGFGPQYLTEIIGVVKAYVSRVGAGPFPTQMTVQEEEFRNFAGEFGAVTSRPRKLGWLDIPMLRYSARVNGITSFALSRVDTLQYFDVVKICDFYTIDGERFDELPLDHNDLFRAIPHYIEFRGWHHFKNISDIREGHKLPEQLLCYIDFIEKATNVPIKYVSVGPERDQTILM